ncbi:MAG: dolichyl-phosphate-mannose--protein mannosyltransferase [Alistipes sp.]|nr:dolichyl-phosphate-mannose--protein mannosyltransferase [Alistipes sp.]
MKPRHFVYILLLLPVLIMRDYQPSHELKYLSIVDEALENNTWFAFYNHGEPYADKPPLFFWGMMIAKKLTGRHLLWLIGLLSLVPAAGVMAVMDKWFARAGIAHYPLASNLMLGTCVMFLGAAGVLRMDMLMLFFIVLSLYTFYKIYSGQANRWDRWLLPVWIFLALFSKGPVGLLVPVLSIVVFLAVKRDLRFLVKCFGGGLMILVLSALWFFMVYLDGGPEYLDNLLFKQTVGRGIDAYHHKEPFWYYFVHILWMLAPWTLLIAAAMGTGLKNRIMRNDTQKFFFCIMVVTFLMLTAFSSKVQIYMLPVFPFLVYLASAYMYGCGRCKWIKAGIAVPAVVAVLALPASLYAAISSNFGFRELFPVILGMAVISAGALWSVTVLRKQSASRGAAVLSFSILLGIAVSAFSLPVFNQYIGFGTMAKGGVESASEAGADNYAYFRFYRGQNMDVYTGRPMHFIGSVEEVDSLIRAERPTVIFMLDKELDRVDGLVEILGDREPAGRVNKYRWYVLGGEDTPEP